MYPEKAIGILDDLLNRGETFLTQSQRYALAFAINNGLLPLVREQEEKDQLSRHVARLSHPTAILNSALEYLRLNAVDYPVDVYNDTHNVLREARLEVNLQFGR
jgi:hypothetical protein